MTQKQLRPRFFFDVGGTGFGAQSEPVGEDFDSNQFLTSILGGFKGFLKDRITVEEIIARLGARLYQAGWFEPIQYQLVYPDKEAEVLVGSYSQRYEYANSSEISFGIQLRASFEEDGNIDVFINRDSKERDRSYHLAELLCNVLNTGIDPEGNCEHLKEIVFGEYSSYDSLVEWRELANGLKYAEFPIVGVCLGIPPNGRLLSYLSTVEGQDKLIAAFSRYFDIVAQEMKGAKNE